MLGGALAVACTLAACKSSGGHDGGTTTTTDATAYAIAYQVCSQFTNTDVARNAEPLEMTDEQADLVFANLAQTLEAATKRDPKAWSKLQAVANRLRAQLAGTSASDEQIESTITKMADACKAAHKRPANLPTVPTTGSSTTTSTTAAGA